MKGFEFTKTKKVDGVIYPAGTFVPRATINPGVAESLLRLGEIVEAEYPDPAPAEPPTPAEGAPSEAPPATPAKGKGKAK